MLWQAILLSRLIIFSCKIFCAVRLKFETCVIFVVVDILILLFVFFGSFENLTDYVLEGLDCSFLLQLVSADLSEYKIFLILVKHKMIKQKERES